jgi:hypothetical protein
MNQQLESGQMIQILESFLQRFREYANEIFGKHDHARLDQLRSELRREEPQVTRIIVKVTGNSQIRLGHSGIVSTKDLLATTLLAETMNFLSTLPTLMKLLLPPSRKP